MTEPFAHYFVTDIECDGPSPMTNSMLSFATVVVREDGELCGEFEAVLQPRPDRQPDERTMEFWRTQPEAWSAATLNPQPPNEVMGRFADWVESYTGKRSFAARPVVFDGIWIDHYLRDFADSYLLDVPHWGRSIFTAGALDIGTYISGIFNRTDPHTGDIEFPASWLGNHEHTHRAIDDARGYASLLSRLLLLAAGQPAHPEDFIGNRRQVQGL
ncbi:MAG: 3'-5' exoribonuclease domain-containing protein [Hyphomicrobiales bacterium]